MPLFRKKRDTPDPDATKVGSVVVRPHLPRGDPAVGSEVAGYRITGELGRGGMGVVYRAEHLHLGREVALKLLAPGLIGNFRDRFIRESQLAASLSHPNIVTVYDAGEADGTLWIAMQLVGGTDLRHMLREGGPLDAEQTVQITHQVASALDAAHGAGLVHRDVKPANILLDNGRAYLSDFGLTKRLASRTDITAKNDVVGTPDYLAPEQIEGAQADGRVDQYALACVVHHSLAGAPPFERDSDIAVLQAHLTDRPPRLSELRDGIPAEVDDVLARAMSKDPGERFPAASEFAAALATAAGVVSADATEAADRAGPGVVLVGASDASSRAVIRAALVRGSAELAEAEDVDGLIALAERTKPGLVLLDAALPGAAVEETVRRLRDSAGRRVPVVALADRGADEGWRAALKAGADDVLLRPFSAFQLMAKVRDHMPRALER